MHSMRTMAREVDIVSDEATDVQAAREDPSAFGVLYERYRDRVYAYLYTRTDSPEDAADLTQQVFLRALDALPDYRGQHGMFAAWLFRIARNAAIDFHRQRRPIVTWDLLPEALHPIAKDNPEANVVHQESIGRLHAILATFNQDTRELLALRFAARLTVAQTAAILGKSEAAVKKQLGRTMRRLKERYHDHTR